MKGWIFRKGRRGTSVGVTNMEKLYSSKFEAVAEKLQVDHEDGLTTAQLMVRPNCNLFFISLLRRRNYIL